jgi:uncharacterized membrane protein YphA (DoxX/SURF4 family)
MKAVVTVVRILVGILFIFSGLVKANDPLGLSYKMQEFFEVWQLHGWDGITLALSVFMNAFEIIAGFALLIGWQFRLISWLLLLLIVFFTFLTGYTYVTGMPKNCGCFGDCLPITAQTSFIKDLVLTVLIIFLILKRKYVRPLLKLKVAVLPLILVIVASFGFQYFTLRNLPVVDCLPFKQGNNILAKRQVPANAIPDSFAIRFIYSKGGKEFEFAPLELPADLSTYKFVSRKDKLIRKGNAEAAIKGFDLKGQSGTDSTLQILQQPIAILLIGDDFNHPSVPWTTGFARVYKTAKQKNIPAFIITGQVANATEAMKGTDFSALPIYTCDNTTIRTAARANPTMYIIQQATITGKWSSPDFDKAEKILAGLPSMPPLPAPMKTQPPDSIH